MDLLTMKMREKVLKDVSVSDEEVMAEYKSVNRKLDLDYIGVVGASFKKEVTVTDDEAREYLKKNGSEFMVPVKVKAFYAYSDLKEAAGKVKVTDAEISEFYEKNLKQFETPEEARARHILIRPEPEEADKEKARAEAKAKADDILKRLKIGEDFAALARANSADPGSAKLGGELGWFPRGVMVKSFEAAVFSLRKGELSPVVETEFGYHIILLEEKKEAGLVPLNKAKESIIGSLKGKKSKMEARDAVVSIEKAFKEAKTPDELKKAASAGKGIKTVTTGLFSEDDKKTVLATNESLKNSIFFLKAGETTQIVDGGDGYYIVRLLEKVDAHVPDYNEIAERVKERVASIKANERARLKAEELLTRVKGGEDLGAIAKKDNYKLESTGYFSRADGFIPKIGAYAAENDKLFALNEAAPVYTEILGQDGRFYLLRLKGVKEAAEADLGPMKEELKSRILARKQEEVLSKWLEGLRSKAKIQVYENML
jgi:peptidyl-prolyl cis-trans isomerase D